MSRLFLWFCVAYIGLICGFVGFYLLYKMINYIFFRRKLNDISRVIFKILKSK